MKKLFYLFAVVSMVFAFTSCGGGGSSDNLPDSLTSSSSKTSKISAQADAPISAQPIVFTLNDFKEVAEFSKKLSSGSLLQGTQLSFSGLPTTSGFQLKNVILSLGKEKYEIKTLDKNGDILTTDYYNFLQKVLNDVVNKKSATIMVEGVSNTKIDDAELKVNIKADFKFKK